MYDTALFDQAKTFVMEEKTITIVKLQRKLRIGYPLAASLIKKLQQAGIIGERDPRSGAFQLVALITDVLADVTPANDTGYQRPELTADDKRQAEADAATLVRKYGYTNFPKMLAALCLENVRLVKEINDHRAARGIEPLKTFKV